MLITGTAQSCLTLVIIFAVANEAALCRQVFDEDGVEKFFDSFLLSLSRSRIVFVSQVKPEQWRLIEQQQVCHLPAA